MLALLAVEKDCHLRRSAHHSDYARLGGQDMLHRDLHVVPYR